MCSIDKIFSVVTDLRAVVGVGRLKCSTAVPWRRGGVTEGRSIRKIAGAGGTCSDDGLPMIWRGLAAAAAEEAEACKAD